jgi:hypothetical protein
MTPQEPAMADTQASILAFDPFEGDFGDQGDRTLSDALVKARKLHACSHCTGPIAIGEQHRSRSDIAGGELMRWRWCALCCEAMAAQASGQEGYPFDRRSPRGF